MQKWMCTDNCAVTLVHKPTVLSEVSACFWQEKELEDLVHHTPYSEAANTN